MITMQLPTTEISIVIELIVLILVVFGTPISVVKFAMLDALRTEQIITLPFV